MKPEQRTIDLNDVKLVSDNDLFENAPTGSIITSADGAILRANQTFLKSTGYKSEEIIGRRFQTLLSPGGRIFYETHYSPMLVMAGRVSEVALDVIRADGSTLAILANSVTRYDESESISSIHTVIFEATFRRKFEEDLVRARRAAEESEARARALAETLQESLLPPSAPVLDHVAIGTAFRPAGSGVEIGGDFYDFLRTAPNEWSVVIGDVGGKGAAAAAITSTARYALRNASIATRDPSEALTMLNETLLMSDSNRICTAVYGTLEPLKDGVRFRFSVAGHPLPVVIRASGEVGLVGTPGMLLGAVQGEEFFAYTSEVTLLRGDTLVMFTDGVTEARAADEFYEKTELDSFFARQAGVAADAVAKNLLADALKFQSGFSRDDIAIVTIQAI